MKRITSMFVIGIFTLAFGESIEYDSYSAILTLDATETSLIENVQSYGLLGFSAAVRSELISAGVSGVIPLFPNEDVPLLRRHFTLVMQDSIENESFFSNLELIDDAISQCAPNAKIRGIAIPNDPYLSGDLFGVRSLHADDAWDIVTGDPSITVGVIDYGLDITNPQISHAVWVNAGEDIDQDGVVGDLGDINGVDDDNNGHIDDLYGWNDQSDNYQVASSVHGTQVAGVISARTNDATGVVGIAGGWYSSVTSVKIAPYSIDGSDFIASIFRGVRYLSEFCSVVNISLSTVQPLPMDEQEVWLDIINEVVVPNDVVLVAGAGQAQYAWQTGAEIIASPANSQYVVAVTASYRDPNKDIYKPLWANWHENIDLCAPGVNQKVISGSGYTLQSGTSFSSPYVAASAALMRSVNPSLDREQVRSILKNNATPVADPVGDEMGAGQLNIFAGLLDAISPPAIPALSVNVSGTYPLLTWTASVEPDFDHYDLHVTYKLNKFTTIRDEVVTVTSNSFTDTQLEIVPFRPPVTATYEVRAVDVASQASVYSNSVTAYGDGGIGIPKGISNVELPEEFAMSNPFPNPFNSQLNYILGIPEPAEVIVQLYNINGRIVGEKAIPQIQAGVHQLAWNFSSSDKLVLSSGIYFFSCTINPLEGKRKPFKAIMKSTFVR